MAGSSGHWLLTASLIGVLSTTVPVLAQAGRPWVDPPPENGTTPSSPAAAPAASPPQAAAPTSPTPQPSSTASAPLQPAQDKETLAAQSRPEVSPRKEKAGEQAKQKTVTERKVRPSSQQARSAARPQKREEQATRRREPSPEVSQARAPRNGIERRARVTRHGSGQEGVHAGLVGLRLRTIQLPDGRRIRILTGPNQDIPSQPSDGY